MAADAHIIYPSVDSPLCQSGILFLVALYGELPGHMHSIRLMGHPSTWLPSTMYQETLWTAVSIPTGAFMLPCLALMMSLVFPSKLRLAYVTLRHAVYLEPGVHCLGDLGSHVLSRMMATRLSKQSISRVLKVLRPGAPTLDPLSCMCYLACAFMQGEVTGRGLRSIEKISIQI